MSDKKEVETILLPEARLINHSLFEKDAFTDEKGREGTPQYKVELVLDPASVYENKAFDDKGEPCTLEDLCVFAAMDEWGDSVEDLWASGVIESPLRSGDDKAANREKRGKPGEAYKGKVIVNASTIFNHEGADAPGGVYIALADGSALPFTERGKIYNGSYGIAAVVISPWSIDRRRGVKFYLQGWQFTKDGEHLRGAGVSALFKPVGRTEGAAAPAAGRRSRKG